MRCCGSSFTTHRAAKTRQESSPVFGQSLPLWMWPDRNLVILQPCVYIYMWVQSHKQTYYYIYQ